MAFDDAFAGDALASIYETFGVDATATRGTAEPVPLRIVVDRNQARLGEVGQVIARVDRVRCQVAQWTFEQDDVLAWTDRLGTHSKRVESEDEDDGLESFGVLHG